MNGIWICRVLFILFSLPALLLAAPSVEATNDLTRAQGIYKSALTRIEMKYIALKTNAPIQYLQSLDTLEKTYQQNGDFKSVMAVRTEKEQFNRDLNTPRQDVDGDPMELKKVKAKMRAAPVELEAQKKKENGALVAAYLSRLEAIQRDATRRGSFTLAAEVQTEIDKARATDNTVVPSVTPTMSSVPPDLQLTSRTPPVVKSNVPGQVIPWKDVSGRIWVTCAYFGGNIIVYLNDHRIVEFDRPQLPTDQRKSQPRYTTRNVTLKAGDVITAKIRGGALGIRDDLNFAGILFVSNDGKSWTSTTSKNWQEYVPVDSKKWWQIKDLKNLVTYPLGRSGSDGDASEIRQTMLKMSKADDADMELVWSKPPKKELLMFKVVTAEDLAQTTRGIATEPDSSKDQLPRGMVKPPEDLGDAKILEGEGWRGFKVGATREELIKDLGKPDNDSSERWLQWKKKYSIHCLIDDTRGAFELRFDQGFKGETTAGIEIGSPLTKALAAYGEPSTQEDRGGAKKLIWSAKGILIWFSGDKANQIVVFPKN